MSVIYRNGQPYATTGKLTEDELNLFKYSDGQTDVSTQVQSNSYLIRTAAYSAGIKIPLGYNAIIHEDKVLQIVRGTDTQFQLENGASGKSQATFRQGRVYVIPEVTEDDTLLCWADTLHVSNNIYSNGYLLTSIDSTNLVGNLPTPSKPKIYALDLNGIVLLGASQRIGAINGPSVASTFTYGTLLPTYKMTFELEGYLTLTNLTGADTDENLNYEPSFLIHLLRYTNYKPR